MERLLVIGGLAAGPAAAAKAKRLRPDLEVVLFEAGGAVSYSVCSLPYWIGGTLTDERDLVPFDPARLLAEKGFEARLHHVAREVLPGRRLIVVEDLASGRLIEERYDALLLAIGSRAVPPPWNAEPFANSFTVKTLADARALAAELDRSGGGNAVVLGAGYLGLEMAEALTRRGRSVTLIDRASEPGSSFEAPVREWIAAELAENGVRFAGGCAVQSWRAANGRLTALETSAGVFPGDIFVSAVGFIPNTSLARDAGAVLGASGALAVDARQQTSLQAVWAAGDCSEVLDRVSGRPRFLPQAGLAARGGRIAAENICGERAENPGAVGTLAVACFRLELAQTGLSLAEAQRAGFDAECVWTEEHSRARAFPGAARVRIALVVEKRTRRLLGASAAGRDGAALRIDVVATAIAAGWTAAQLASVDLMYTPPLAPMWDPLTRAALKADRRE